MNRYINLWYYKNYSRFDTKAYDFEDEERGIFSWSVASEMIVSVVFR